MKNLEKLYSKVNKQLEQYARDNNIKHYEIVEDSYEFENGLLFIAYDDENHEFEDFHFCIDVAAA